LLVTAQCVQYTCLQEKGSDGIFEAGGMKMKLHVVIEQDEAGYYVAEVPALPGCLSQGKTHAEALANVKEAVAGWLETMEAKTELDLNQSIEVMV
jgi:antitoxin HicB